MSCKLAYNAVDKRLFLCDNGEQLIVAQIGKSGGQPIINYPGDGQKSYSLLMIQGVLHRFTSHLHSSDHLVWNKVQKRFVDAVLLPVPSFMMPGCGALFIYVPSKNIILAIGGEERKNACHGIWKYYGIWRFHVDIGRWEYLMEIEQSINGIEMYHGCSAVLSSNERYVIFMGRIQREMRTMVLDIGDADNYHLWESSVYPVSSLKNSWGYHRLAKTGGPKTCKLLVRGWIRKLLSSAPMDIVHLLGQYSSSAVPEMVHCMRSLDGNEQRHYVIPLQDILDNRKVEPE